jgi:hypothetical protein
MKDFLKFKPGDIIIVTIGLPLALGLGLKLFMKGYNNPALEDKLIFVILMIGVSAFIGWLWAAVIGLQDKIPRTVKRNVKLFKATQLVPFIYVVVLVLLVLLDSPAEMNTALKSGAPVVNKTMDMVSQAFMVLNTLSVACIVYGLFYVAKTVKMAELQRKVYFLDFAGIFLLICVFPVGIWIVQPKINKMMED